jgi:uncharacterized protein (TIGR02996 family)
MPHAHDDFLNTIAAEPADRTVRLVYADWLDDHDDPRGELIRIEEEMRALPVFADRFWERKPRRNDLRARAGDDWCARMRYGTDAEPVFRHGVPDGWRERWRLIREFTERWHLIPMPDIGGRLAEIANVEAGSLPGYYGSLIQFRQAKAGSRSKLPLSVCEWVAFLRDVGGEWDNPDSNLNWLDAQEVRGVPGHAAASLWWSKDPEGGRLGDTHFAVRLPTFHQPDPPVYAYHEGLNDEYETEITTSDTPYADTVSAFALDHVLNYTSGAGGFVANVEKVDDLFRDLNHTVPYSVEFGGSVWYEADNILIRVEPWRWRSGVFHLIVLVAKPISREQIPDFLWPYARLSHSARGGFAPQ